MNVKRIAVVLRNRLLHEKALQLVVEKAGKVVEKIVEARRRCWSGGKSIGSVNESFMNLIPIVVEQTGRGERAYDIFSRLLERTYYFSWAQCVNEMWRILSLLNSFSLNRKTQKKTSISILTPLAVRSLPASLSTTPCNIFGPMSLLFV